MFLDFSKKTHGGFGFSRFLVLENLENPTNTMCFFFLIFPVFIEKSQKHHDFKFRIKFD